MPHRSHSASCALRWAFNRRRVWQRNEVILCRLAVVFATAAGNELDSSAPKFRKASNTRFVASVLGIYKMSFHGINQACGCKSAVLECRPCPGLGLAWGGWFVWSLPIDGLASDRLALTAPAQIE